MSEQDWQDVRTRLDEHSLFGIDLGLERMRRALHLEGDPHAQAPAILVGGTNGKGGTAAFLGGLLQAHGLRIGLYTSPHILDIPERFRLDGRPMAADRVFPTVDGLLDRYGGDVSDNPRLTYFEITTLTAACLFERADVDVAIYEVGLGGRLDATNAIEPDLSVVTTVGLDHTEHLGDTIREIAGEKAGILREGRPAVVGRQDELSVCDVLERTGAEPLRRWGRDFELTSDGDGVVVGDRRIDDLQPAAPCRTRRENMATAVQAASTFLGADFSSAAAREGIRRTRWPGRMDRRRVEADVFETPRDVTVLFDSAHNPPAVRTLFDSLDDSDTEPGAFVVSGLADKALAEIFAPLSGRAPVFPAMLEAERGATADALTDALPVEPHRAPADAGSALAAACRHVASTDERGAKGPVVVFGSIYLVGACFRALGITVDELRSWVPAV